MFCTCARLARAAINGNIMQVLATILNAYHAVFRFAQLLRFKTLADAHTEDHLAAGYEGQFTLLLQHLEAAYPAVYKNLRVQKVELVR